MTSTAPSAGDEGASQNQLPASSSDVESNSPSEQDVNRTFTSDEVEQIVKDRLKRQASAYGLPPSEVKNLKTELESLKQSTLTETEKAIQKAKLEARAEIEAEYRERLAAVRLETALSAVVDDPAAIVADLKVSNYLTEEGEVDAEKVAALVSRFSPKKTHVPRTHGLSSNGQTKARTPADAFAEMLESQGL